MARSAGGDRGRQPPHGPPSRLPILPDVGLYLVDAQGAIVEVNQKAELLLGRTATDLLGENAHDLLHRDDHGHTVPSSQCPMLRAFPEGRPTQGERDWHERGDGSLLALSWLAMPHTISQDRPGTLVICYEPAPYAAEAVPAGTPWLTELERLALLAETTSLLTSTLNAEETVHRLTRLVVPRLADWAVVDLVYEGEGVRRAAVVHYEDGDLVRYRHLEGQMPALAHESPLPLARALRGAASAMMEPATFEAYTATDAGFPGAQRELFRETGMHSAAIAPIPGLREVLGALTLGRSDRPGAYTDLSLLEDITRRAGLALDNARMYQRQRHVSETMQRHLLPQLPDIPGLRATVRYASAPEDSQVGGDWYDVFRLRDGTFAMAVGDVVGHDIDAAATMAQIRNILRAYAWSYQEPPSRIVHRVDQAVEHVTDVPMATLCLLRVESGAGNSCLLRWSNAGHPPPLLVTRDGHTRLLDGFPDPVIGTGQVSTRTDSTADFPELATLVLYTDGLIESPTLDIDVGLDRLRQQAAALARSPLDTFCDELLSNVRPADNHDDVALLALRRPSTGRMA